jgi:very-short-patch-repair endonuclease
MDADVVISRLAAGQHAAVARSQLLAEGVSRHAIDRRLARGVLVGVHSGVYRVASTADSWSHRIMAATLATGPGSVASHRAAGYLHGLTGIEPKPEVTVARARAPRPPGILVHRADEIARPDVEVRDGIPRTRAAATLVGLAGVVPAPLLEAALDDALLRGLVNCSQLQRRLAHTPQQGRRGVRALAQLLAARSGAPRWTQSEFERRLWALFDAAGIARPVPQFEVVLPDGRRAYLDFAWPEVRLGLEADSYRHHGSRQAWARDHRRNNLLIALGWRILPVTWDQLVEAPEELIALVLRALAA